MDKGGFDDGDDDKYARSRGDDEKQRSGRGRRVRNEEPNDEQNLSSGFKASENKLMTESSDTTPSGTTGKGRRRRAADENNGQENVAAPKSAGGGWMDSAAPKPSTMNDDDIPGIDEAQGSSKSKHFGKEKEDDEILVIPDLDEDAGTDGDHRVAHAPRNLNRKVPTRVELENDVKATLPNIEGGFDLAVLLGTLVPADMVREDDVSWTFESLLRDVTDELQASSTYAPPKAPEPEAPIRVRGEQTKL